MISLSLNTHLECFSDHSSLYNQFEDTYKCLTQAKFKLNQRIDEKLLRLPKDEVKKT